MIRAVAFVPTAPVLVPDVARGAAPELEDLRVACRTAIRTAAGADPRAVLVLAGHSKAHGAARAYDSRQRGSLDGIGVPLVVGLGPDSVGPPDLPLPLTVGAWLVRDALGPDVSMTAVTVPASPDTTAQVLDDPDRPVVVLGDGTARRTRKAPGYLDERAAAFDATIEQALRDGDVEALAALEPDLGADLLAAGVPAWHAIAPLLAGREWDSSVLYADDPYGVMYFAASWVARG